MSPAQEDDPGRPSRREVRQGIFRVPRGRPRGGGPPLTRGQGGSLPVDPDRLRRQFPELDDDDLVAYAEVTRRILADQTSRARMTREVMERARVAEEKQSAGQPLTAEEDLALRYHRAVGKMQRSTVRRS